MLADSVEASGNPLLEEREIRDGHATDAAARERSPRAEVAELDAREEPRPPEGRNHVEVRQVRGRVGQAKVCLAFRLFCSV